MQCKSSYAQDFLTLICIYQIRQKVGRISMQDSLILKCWSIRTTYDDQSITSIKYKAAGKGKSTWKVFDAANEIHTWMLVEWIMQHLAYFPRMMLKRQIQHREWPIRSGCTGEKEVMQWSDWNSGEPSHLRMSLWTPNLEWAACKAWSRWRTWSWWIAKS